MRTHACMYYVSVCTVYMQQWRQSTFRRPPGACVASPWSCRLAPMDHRPVTGSSLDACKGSVSSELLVVVALVHGGAGGAPAGVCGDVGDAQAGVVDRAGLPLGGEHHAVGAQPLAAGARGDHEPEPQWTDRHPRRAPHRRGHLAPGHVLPRRLRRRGLVASATGSVVDRLGELDGGDVGLAALVEEAEGEVAPLPAARLLYFNRQVLALVRAGYPPEVHVDGRVRARRWRGHGGEGVLGEQETACSSCHVRLRRVGDDDDLDAALRARAPSPAPELVACAAGPTFVKEASADGGNVEAPVGGRRRRTTIPARGAGEDSDVGREDGRGGAARAPAATVRAMSARGRRRGQQQGEDGGHGREECREQLRRGGHDRRWR
ncbi:hypothetical protein D1007_08349 [Hordeum vulgare]|nr:hypothetical protein D1007_08349 [Hordeum vulgare]